MSKSHTDSKIADWKLVIEPSSSLFDIPFHDLWRYRDLLWLLVKRDFVSFYKQTILGPLWYLVQPLLTTFVYTFIFGKLAGLSTDGLPQPLFYMVGITGWNYFADCLVKTSTVFRDNAQIFGKVYFPRLIMPMSIVIGNLVRFGVQLLLMVAMMVWYSLHGTGMQVTWALALFPFSVVLMALLGLGMGLIITALTTKYRDLAFLVSFGVQLLMYGTTVIYPLSSIAPRFRTLILLNPMTGIIESIRYGLLGKGYLTFNTILYATAVTVLTLAAGILIFNKTEKNFIDTV